jgi:hypothetical protein
VNSTKCPGSVLAPQAGPTGRSLGLWPTRTGAHSVGATGITPYHSMGNSRAGASPVLLFLYQLAWGLRQRENRSAVLSHLTVLDFAPFFGGLCATSCLWELDWAATEAWAFGDPLGVCLAIRSISEGVHQQNAIQCIQAR